MPEINTGGVGILDYDSDGWMDVYLVDGGTISPAGIKGGQSRLFRNQGSGRFADVTQKVGLAGDHGYGMGVTCADYDGDGHTDLYLLNLNGNVLWRNRGDGTFENVTSRAGVAGSEWSSSATFFDADRDGDLDLFVVNYLHWSVAAEVDCFSRGGTPDYCSPLSYRAPAMDRFYRNRGDGTFSDESKSVGLAQAFGNGLGVVASDFDQDGWTDVFVANDATPNQLWLNRRGERFDETALLRGCALNAAGVPRAGMGVVAVDLRGTGWMDLLVTHLVGEGNGWFANAKGYFTDVISPRGPMLGSRAFTGFGIGVRDFDHDGEWDVFVANGRVRLGVSDLDGRDPYAEPNHLLRGVGGGEFAEVRPQGGTQPVLVGASRGAAVGDFDNDGAEDIVVVNKDGPAHLLMNRATAGHSWLGLDLRDAEGRPVPQARVVVRAGDRSWHRQVQPNEGYASSHDPRLVFGLGTGARADAVTVIWPWRATNDYGALDAGRYHRITAPPRGSR